MVAPQSDSEQVRYDIIIEAKAALAALQDLLRLTDDNSQKVKIFSNVVLEQSQAMGVAWKELLGVYKQLNTELSQSHQANVFGPTGGQDLMGQSEQYLQTLQETGRLEQDVAQGATAMGSAGETAANKFVSGMHFVRIALGAIEAMLLFNLVQAVQTFFQTAIKNAEDLEASLYRLHNAERILSEEGINVSTKGLEDGILRIKKLLPIFSKEDITGEVGQIAIMTKSLGLTEQQILDLSKAVAIYNVNSVANETLQQTTQRVLSSLLTSNAKGVADLGIKLGDAAIEAKAFEMGMLRAGESVSSLTAHEKDLAKLQIILDTAGASVDGLNEYLDTNTARIQKNKAAWNDLLTNIGQVLLPFVPILTNLFGEMNREIDQSKAFLVAFLAVLLTFKAVFDDVIHGNIKSLGDFKRALQDIGAEIKKALLQRFFPEGLPDNAPSWMKQFFGNAGNPQETPTNPNGVNPAEQQSQSDRVKVISDVESKIQNIMQESADKKANIELDYGRKLEDIATQYSQKLEDIARDTAHKREDALRAYNQKVEDINRQADQAEAQAKADARQKEIDREKEYQQKLKELREKFLMDLEDALRNRDARQVLRLIKQYNLDKKNLADRQKLDQQQAKRDLANKLKQIEQERQLKLQAAQREYQDKLQEIAIGEARALEEAQIWRKRQTEDANIWYQRQMADYRQYLQQKLRDLANSLAQEYKLTAQGAAAIYKLLQSYFGAGGLNTNLLASFAQALANIIQASSSSGSGSTGSSSTTSNTGGGFAEGGTYLATRPTRMLVGEKGAEKITVTPLTKPGNNTGQIFGDKSAAGTNGNVHIRLELSPDLEAKIIESSLESVALTLDKVTRSK